MQVQKPKIKKLIENLNKPGENLSNRMVIGGFWVVLLRIVKQLFSLARLVILARVLAPHDFGLMGVALLTMATLDTFSQTGFQAALIQKKENIEPYLNVAWTVLILRGFILFAVLYFIAPYAAMFFDVADAKSIIQVIGFAVLFQAFTNIGVVYFQKELEFDKQFIYQFAGVFTDFIVAVFSVLILKNVWALVLGLLAGNLTRAVVSYLIHPYRPHLSFDFAKVKELFGFGKWVLGSSILVFLLTQGDDAFVGKILGITALGFYQLAYRISNMPATEISHVISQVTFPAYSKLQDDIPRLKEVFFKVVQFTAFLFFPLAGMIWVLAPDFTRLFLGEKWLPMVPSMQVLAIFGGIRALNATTGPVFWAAGKPSFLTKISLMQLIFLAVIIYPLAINEKLLGVSLAVTLANLFCSVLAFREALVIIKESKKNIVKIIMPSLLVTATIIGFIYLFKIIAINRLSPVIIFVVSSLIGLSTYLIYGRILGVSFITLIKKVKSKNI